MSHLGDRDHHLGPAPTRGRASHVRRSLQPEPQGPSSRDYPVRPSMFLPVSSRKAPIKVATSPFVMH